MKFKLGFLAFCAWSFNFAYAGGVDLNLLHGSRYIALGGHHVALKDDAYGIFYNPANMTTATGPMIAADQFNLLFQYEAPLETPNAQRKSIMNWGPFFYLGGVYPINDRFTAGFAIFPTAAQGGKFEGVDYGPLITNKEYSNRLIRIEMSPAIAVKLIPQISLGAAWKIGYTQYDKAAGVFADAANSVYLKSSLNNWDFKGLKVGSYFDNLAGLTAGLTFRFENPIELKGDGDMTFSPDSGASVVTMNGEMKQEITLPAQFQAGVAYEFWPGRLLGTFTYEYTMSSSLASDSPEFTSNPTLQTVFTPAAMRTELNYRNSHAYHFGTEYTHPLSQDRKFSFGVGLALDTNATPQSHPNPVLAPNAMYWGWAGGARYMTSHHEFGFAVNYGQYSTDVSAAQIDTDLHTAALGVGKVMPGKYSLKAFFAGLDYTYRF